MCRPRMQLLYVLFTAIHCNMPLYKVIYLLILIVSQIASVTLINWRMYYFSIYILLGLIYETLFLLIEDKSFLINGYVVLSIFYFGYFYYSTISNNKLRVFLKYFVLTNILLSFYFLASMTYNIYNQPMILFLCIYAIILSLLFFVDMIIKPRAIKLIYEFPFWVSCGLLFWATMFIFNIGAIYHLNNTDRVFLKSLQIGLYLTNIVAYMIYLFGMISIWKKDNKKT